MVSRGQALYDKNVAEAEARLIAFEESLRTLDGDLNLSLVQLDRIDHHASKNETVFTADQYGFIKSEIVTVESQNHDDGSRTSIGGFSHGSLIIQDEGGNEAKPKEKSFWKGAKSQIETDKLRCKKWQKMLTAIRNKKNQKKLKSRARKGIPNSMRGQAWPVLANVDL